MEARGDRARGRYFLMTSIRTMLDRTHFENVQSSIVSTASRALKHKCRHYMDNLQSSNTETREELQESFYDLVSKFNSMLESPIVDDSLKILVVDALAVHYHPEDHPYLLKSNLLSNIRKLIKDDDAAHTELTKAARLLFMSMTISIWSPREEEAPMGTSTTELRHRIYVMILEELEMIVPRLSACYQVDDIEDLMKKEKPNQLMESLHEERLARKYKMEEYCHEMTSLLVFILHLGEEFEFSQTPSLELLIKLFSVGSIRIQRAVSKLLFRLVTFPSVSQNAESIFNSMFLKLGQVVFTCLEGNEPLGSDLVPFISELVFSGFLLLTTHH